MTRGSGAPAGYFFTASPLKLCLMTICTLGAYEFYWFYKNWELQAQRAEKKIRPVWRAMFAPLWAYAMFRVIQNAGENYQIRFSIKPAALAAAYLALMLFANAPGPLWLVSFLSLIPILVANNAATIVNQNLVPGFRQNSGFSAKNYAILIIGGIFFILAVIGTFIEGKSLPVTDNLQTEELNLLRGRLEELDQN